ncbi:amidohydrolase family protein [Achromobacter aloeverae]|uniref:Amidohydrolase n=1 Tax=Achromobacter aloeverae TaxID=1750518 RepID=A0A4V1MSH3_9BURK|nr:amidohydrolase family protein [Achromobacter aloeverae]RXN91579.1 amidohydrolase [Achromobacter aloeverae]
MPDIQDEDLPVVAHKPPAASAGTAIEAAIDPDLPIIDPHHHFSSHWGGYFVEDLRADMQSGHAVAATVYIQCGHAYRADGPEALKPVGETEYVVAQCAAAGRVGKAGRMDKADRGIAAGIVGHADLRLGEDVDEVLAAHIEAGQGRFRGIRHSGARHPAFKHGVLSRPPAGLYGDPAFRKGYARLGAHGLSFDAWIYHPQIDEVISLAQAFPDIPLILDHVGGVLGVGPYADDRPRALQEWLPELKRLAACPNVRVKLGGLGTATFGFDFSQARRPPDSEMLAALWRPYFEPCLELFGADRCMFESNFPVDRSAGSYAVLWNAFKRIAQAASPDERSALFHGTAAATYRLAPLVAIG